MNVNNDLFAAEKLNIAYVRGHNLHLFFPYQILRATPPLNIRYFAWPDPCPPEFTGSTGLKGLLPECIALAAEDINL